MNFLVVSAFFSFYAVEIVMEKLSDEILVRIFSFLSARDLCRCSQVCNVAQFREKMLAFLQAGGKFTSLFTSNFFFDKNCFQFLLGITFVPRESEYNAYVKFCGVNKLYHGQCERAGERFFDFCFCYVFL